MTEDSFIYSFTLNYNPQPLGNAPVVRTAKTAVIVECHYQRCEDSMALIKQNTQKIVQYVCYVNPLAMNYRMKSAVLGAPCSVGFCLVCCLIEHVLSLRKSNVSSLPLDPVWNPFSAVKVAEEFLYFTLKLMTGNSKTNVYIFSYYVYQHYLIVLSCCTDNWLYERPSYQYFLGDIINIEATVKQYHHIPLRVYVDTCVATLSRDANSNPRYVFIENHG